MPGIEELENESILKMQIAKLEQKYEIIYEEIIEPKKEQAKNNLLSELEAFLADRGYKINKVASNKTIFEFNEFQIIEVKHFNGKFEVDISINNIETKTVTIHDEIDKMGRNPKVEDKIKILQHIIDNKDNPVIRYKYPSHAFSHGNERVYFNNPKEVIQRIFN